jgi:hypothetical protein
MFRCPLEGSDSLAERVAQLRQLLRPEQQNQYDEDDEQLGREARAAPRGFDFTASRSGELLAALLNDRS